MIQPDEVAGTLEELKPYFSIIVEAQLKDYGESANAGCWVSLRLPSPEDLEVFRGQDRSGRNARSGKRYTLMLIEIDDQDEHVQPEHKAYKLSQIAGMKCNDPNFRAWLQADYEMPCQDAEAAAKIIREMCGIPSRADLDVNQHAAGIFRTLLEDYDRDRGSSTTA